VVDGSASTFASIIVSGVACRYKVLSDGQRQILGFLLPGDMAEDFGAGWSAINHDVSASTPCVLEKIPRVALQRIGSSRILHWLCGNTAWCKGVPVSILAREHGLAEQGEYPSRYTSWSRIWPMQPVCPSFISIVRCSIYEAAV
jgi:CRP-like cAMP-binding protein